MAEHMHPPREALDGFVPSAAPMAMPWLRIPLRMLSPAGRRGRLTIVIFHRVHARPDPLFPNEAHAKVFGERLFWLRSWFNVLPLGEAVAALARGALPERALAITFDDGYADNVTVALPILRQLGLHATFFVAAGFLDGGVMWNDVVIEAVRAAQSPLDLSGLGLGRHAIDSSASRRATIKTILAALKYRPLAERQAMTQRIAAISGAAHPANLMMTSEQLRELAAEGMGVGGHTMTHPILAQLDDAAARREIADGRDALAAIVRQPITLFAYPNGKPNVDYRAVHVQMAKTLGFAAAVSTAWGAARTGDTLHELPRFTPWDRTPLRYGARLARNLLAPGQRAGP
jgi:peptidoglycan/xylan/chitin deacetylase (PgdA/CDA1 family)